MKELVLFIGSRWPEPDTTAAGQRTIQLLAAFQGIGFRCHFVSASQKTEYSADLGQWVERESVIQLNHPSFDELIAGLRPSIVVFDRFMVEEQFGWRVHEHCPEAIQILDTQDLHSLRKYREDCLKKGNEPNNHDWIKTDMAKRELASIYRADLSLVISSYEYDLLNKELGIPEEKLFHIPFLLDPITDSQIRSWPSFSKRKDFAWVGNGQHKPNMDSLKLLLQEIWPQIRSRLPGAKIKVFGAYLPKPIRELSNPTNGIEIVGWVKSIEHELQGTRIILAPIRYGAGIKGKLSLAMQCGTPSITYQKGAEGFPLGKNPWPGAICDNPETFAKHSIDLYANAELWGKAQNAGIQIINTGFSRHIHQERLVEILKVQNRYKKSKPLNFHVQSLLRHQNMAATKYMGKWIQLKNSPKTKGANQKESQ